MDYPTWTANCIELLQVATPQATGYAPATAAPSGVFNFDSYVGTVIANTEIRMQRDLDLLACYVTDTTGVFTPGNRSFTLPVDSGIFQVVTQVSTIIGGATQAPIIPAARDYLEAVYPSDVAVGSPSLPLYWCMVDQTSILVGPAPDQAYGVKVVGTQRMTPISASNPTNFLSINLPDMYMAASMVEWSGWERNYGASSDDARQAVSWEGRYQEILKSASIEELRKKFMSTGWQPRQPSPLAAPVLS